MANLPDKPQIGDTGHVSDMSMIIDAIADLDARKIQTLAIGTVTTDAPGSQATATIVGGPGGTHTLSLSIPAGTPGAKGDPGERGPEGPAGPQGPAGSGGGGGVTDHGALTGLADDDHPQYLNHVRGDDRYPLKADLNTATGTAIANHVAAADPHPGYLKASEVVAGSNVAVDTATTPGSVIISATGGGGAGATKFFGPATNEPNPASYDFWVVTP